MLKIFLIFFLLSSSQLSSQTMRLDSLNSELKMLKPSDANYLEKKVEIINLALEIRSSAGIIEGTEALIDTLAALRLLQGDSLGYYSAIYLHKANLQARNFGSTDEALVNYQKYVFWLKQLGKENEMPYLFVDIGNLYYRVNLNESAIRYYSIALNIFSQKNDYHGLITSYNNIALSQQKLEQLDSSVFYCQKSLDISQQFTKDSFEIAQCYFVLGSAMQKRLDFDKALEAFQKSWAIFENNDLQSYKDFHHLTDLPSEIGRRMAACYLEKNDIAAAKKSWELSALCSKKYGVESAVNRSRHTLMELEILLKEKKFDEAQQLIAQTQPIFQQFSYFESTAYSLMYKAYRANQQTAKMYEYGYKHLKLKDSLENNAFKQKTLTINNLVLQLENEQVIELQNVQILNQQIERERQLAVSYGLLAALLIACLICGIIVFFVVKLRRQNQLIQRYAADLERSNKDKELLLTVIGHDIRSPFQVVFRNIDAAYQYFNVAKESPILKHLSNAKKSAEQAFVMLDNLLQWVVIQQNNIQPKLEQVDTSRIVEELIAQFKAMSLLESLEVRIETPLPTVQTDPAILLIIVRNLLLNAVKYSKINSQISIKTEYSAENTTLIIENQANEVSRALLHKINNPNQSTNKGVFKGGGLGLQLVQQLAQRLGIQTQIVNIKEDWISTQITFAQASNPDFNPQPQPEQSNNPRILVKIPKSQHEDFLSLIQQLQALEVYETSRLQKIIKDSSFQHSEGARAWWELLVTAIEEVDEQLFINTLNHYQLVDEPIIL